MAPSITRVARRRLTPPNVSSTLRPVTAGWSSPVARWAHNPKVAGSNPAPATNFEGPWSPTVALLLCTRGGTMTDEALVRGFEAATLDEFPHAAHVRVAWWYLTHEPLLVAIGRFKAALRRFAAAKGKPER